MISCTFLLRQKNRPIETGLYYCDVIQELLGMIQKGKIAGSTDVYLDNPSAALSSATKLIESQTGTVTVIGDQN